MCSPKDKDPPARWQEDTLRQEIIDIVNFMFVAHGIVLCTLVTFGLIINLLCLGVLCRKQFKSAPYCLLQALTVGALLVLGFSIYSDILPAFNGRERIRALEEQINKLLDSVQRKSSVNITSNNTDIFLDEAILKVFLLSGDAKFSQKNSSSAWRSRPEQATVWNQSLAASPTSVQDNCLNKTKMDKKSNLNSQPVVQAVDRFLAYFMLTFNMFILASFGFERLFAVLQPVRARAVLTVQRTRYAVLAVVILCLVIHSPQLLKEIITSIYNPELIAEDYRGTLLQSYRRHYEEFVVYLTSSLLVVILFSNCALLTAVFRAERRMRLDLGAGVSRSEVNRKLNITYTILLIVLCQLPQSVASNVMAHLAMAKMMNNLAVFTRVMVVIRVLYVTSSACSCLVYCLLARKFRRAFLDTYFRWCPWIKKLKAEAYVADTTKSPASSPSPLSISRLRNRYRASSPTANITYGSNVFAN